MRPPISYEITDQFIKKGTWSPEEDERLVSYIRRYGIWNWTEMPKAAGLMRTGKSCRLRWMNYLQPNIKRGNYSKEEEEIILKLHTKLGNKWSAIAARLPGRTDNDVKNFWHTHLKKRIEKSQTNVPKQGMDKIKQYGNSPQKEQVPLLPSASPEANSESHPGISNGSSSSGSVSWDNQRGLWDNDDQVNVFSMENFSSMEDNWWFSDSDHSNLWSEEYLWFEESAMYSYTSNEEPAIDFWDGLFMH